MDPGRSRSPHPAATAPTGSPRSSSPSTSSTLARLTSWTPRPSSTRFQVIEEMRASLAACSLLQPWLSRARSTRCAEAFELLRIHGAHLASHTQSLLVLLSHASVVMAAASAATGRDRHTRPVDPRSCGSCAELLPDLSFLTRFVGMSRETAANRAIEVHGYALRVIRQARGRAVTDLAAAWRSTRPTSGTSRTAASCGSAPSSMPRSCASCRSRTTARCWPRLRCATSCPPDLPGRGLSASRGARPPGPASAAAGAAGRPAPR